MSDEKAQELIEEIRRLRDAVKRDPPQIVWPVQPAPVPAPSPLPYTPISSWQPTVKSWQLPPGTIVTV
jgi:hypothetical protein